MNLNGYTHDVARTQKTLLPIDARIAEILAEGVERAEITRRTLADMTGMSLNRLGIILRQEPPPATVGEVGAIARAIGTTASQVTAQAERDVMALETDPAAGNVTHANFGKRDRLEHLRTIDLTNEPLAASTDDSAPSPDKGEA